MTDELMKFQIEKTVKEHLIKEKKYKDKGIKVLSLFFIDRVANYRQYDEAGNQVNGKFAKWFEESFMDISSKTAYKGLIPFSVGEIHNGYFSQDKKGKFKDTQKTAKAKSDIDLTFIVSKKEKTIYSNMMPLDSGVEYRFAKDCETREDIDFYFKLPYWFKIKTPIGNYNPDWAVIKKNEKTVYFVAETKSANQELKTSEKRKIKCGKAHFDEFEGVEYRQVVKVSDLD